MMMMRGRRHGGPGPGVRPGYWFAPKRYGLGATPANAAGWAATAAFLAIFGLAMWLSPNDTLRIATGAPIVIAYLALVRAKTDGDWGWRWGGER